MDIYSSDDPNKVIEEVQDITKNIHAFYKSLEDDQPTAENFIFLGLTGCGKSTLINYISGRELKAVKKKNYRNKYIIEVSNPIEGIVPGHSTSSKTKKPAKWLFNKNVTYWDCPGLRDTIRTDQEIINAFYVNKLLDHCKKSKIVLVVKYETIFGDKHTQLEEIARHLAELNLLNSLSCVFIVIASSESEDIDEFIESLEEDVLQNVSDKNL